MKKNILLIAAIFLLLVSIAYWYSVSSHNNIQTRHISCADITQPCQFQDLFAVRFLETPQPMKPLHLEVQMQYPVKAIHADFAMQGMEMGLNRYRLLAASNPNTWQATITLPVCVQGRSDWEMLLEVESEDGVQRFMVPFSAAMAR